MAYNFSILICNYMDFIRMPLQGNSKTILDYFKEEGGIVRFSTILKAGYHPDSLKALEIKGKVNKIARGIYALSQHEIGPHPDLILASLQSPHGVICLLSALAFHEVTDEIPHRVNMSIPPSAHANRIKYPPVKFFRFASVAWETGIEEHIFNGHTIRIYNLPKTIADCFKFRNKIGMDVVRKALKTALAEKKAQPGDIMHYAGICRITNIIKPVLETLL